MSAPLEYAGRSLTESYLLCRPILALGVTPVTIHSADGGLLAVARPRRSPAVAASVLLLLAIVVITTVVASRSELAASVVLLTGITAAGFLYLLARSPVTFTRPPDTPWFTLAPRPGLSLATNIYDILSPAGDPLASAVNRALTLGGPIWRCVAPDGHVICSTRVTAFTLGAQPLRIFSGETRTPVAEIYRSTSLEARGMALLLDPTVVIDRRIVLGFAYAITRHQSVAKTIDPTSLATAAPRV